MTIKVNIKKSLMGEELACSTEQNYKTCRPVVFKTLLHGVSTIYLYSRLTGAILLNVPCISYSWNEQHKKILPCGT